MFNRERETDRQTDRQKQRGTEGDRVKRETMRQRQALRIIIMLQVGS